MSDIKKTKAILFDLHETITEVTDNVIDLTRKISSEAGVDLSEFSDEKISQAVEKMDKWFKSFQIEKNVDIHFGREIEHWTEANRVMYKELGIDDVSDDFLNSVQKEWIEITKSWETLRPDSKKTLQELHKRGYILGICSRRAENPSELLREWGITDIISTVQSTSVPGYAKPYPYTLILAADEIGINPHRIAFVGNYVDADILAATRAGMVPVLTTWADPEEAKKAPEGTIVIGEVSELLDLFEGIQQ
ncbi:MAG: HAD family hydrolase [Candidatus Thorarchaeota archaeon]